MAGTIDTRKQPNLATSEPRTWLGVVMLITMFYVELNVGQSIVSLTTEEQRVNEGDKALLQCFFEPANAVIGKWYWKANETVIVRSDQQDPNSRYSLSDATSGNVSLMIKSVVRWDKGTFTCGVNDQSTGSTVSHSEDCKLTVNYLDNPKIQALTDTRITEGTRVSMSCKLESSYPKVETITWIHENKIIDIASGKYIVNDDILEIKKFDQSDEGNYRCRAENNVFADGNGKYSNSVSFSLKAEDTSIPSSSSTSLRLVSSIIAAIFALIGVVVAVVAFRCRPTMKMHSIHGVQSQINGMIGKEQQKLERELADPKADLGSREDCEEALDFKNDKVLTVTRGEGITASFKSIYDSKHRCFKEKKGFHDPFFCVTLQSCEWLQKKKILYSSDKHGQKREKYKVNGRSGLIQYNFEVKKHVKNGAEGYLIFKDVNDDDEGQYVYKLQIQEERMSQGALPETVFTFYGKTCIRLTNAIYRTFQQRSVIRPIGLVLSDHDMYAFADVYDDNVISHYVTCAGKLHMENEKITITWNENADILLKQDGRLLSFVTLPGIHHPYIFLGFINASQDRRLQGNLVAFLPDGTFRVINNIVKTLTSEGPIEVLIFDNLSGKKLSNGRLVVCGWVKRSECVGENKRTDVWKVKFCGSTSSRSRLMDIENQSFEYEPFIMWTDDEINWNLGENLRKIEKAEDDMRIQLTETGDGNVYVIISSLESKQVLYKGSSNDYCRTFEEKNRDRCPQMPVLSFALSVNRSLVGAPSMVVKKTAEQQSTVNYAKNKEESSKNAKEEGSPGTSGLASTDDGRVMSTLEKPPAPEELMDESLANAKEEGSPGTSGLASADDGTVMSTLEKPPEDAMEGSSEKVKKRSALGKATSKVAKKFSWISKGESSANKSTKENEDVPINNISSENAKEEGLPVTSRLACTDDGTVMSTLEKPPADVMEESSENIKTRSTLGKVAKTLSRISKRVSSSNNSTQEYENVPTTTDESSLQCIQGKWDGLWHLVQDTTTNKAIRLRPISEHTESSDNGFVTILENRSKVQCEQIVPFTCEDQSLFLMIYTTHFQAEEDHGWCTRYHVFSLESLGFKNEGKK